MTTSYNQRQIEILEIVKEVTVRKASQLLPGVTFQGDTPVCPLAVAAEEMKSLEMFYVRAASCVAEAAQVVLGLRRDYASGILHAFDGSDPDGDMRSLQERVEAVCAYIDNKIINERRLISYAPVLEVLNNNSWSVEHQRRLLLSFIAKNNLIIEASEFLALQATKENH